VVDVCALEAKRYGAQLIALTVSLKRTADIALGKWDWWRSVRPPTLR
jgi:hypothetical protein